MNKSSHNLQQGIYSLGILFLGIVGFYILLIQPAISAKSRNTDRIEDLKFLSSKFIISNQEYELIKEEIIQLKTQNPSNKDFLEDKAPAIVAADLQKQIKALVESSGGTLVSTHALSQAKDELFPKITVKVHMRTDMNALRDVLYQIAINKPLLFTENIVIQKLRTNTRNRQQTNNKIVAQNAKTPLNANKPK